MNRATTILFWFSLALFVSLGLYHTSYRVEEMSQTLKSLNAKIASEQKALHVLKAEWVYLSNPARLETVAKKHLALQPTAPAQVTRIARLAELCPTKTEAMGTTTVAASPVATVSLKAAHRLAPSSGEKDRINTRMVFGHAASEAAASEGGYEASDRLHLEKAALALASSGGAP